MKGRVYFVVAPGRIKIGYTRNPERRLAQLQSSDMEKLVSLGTILGTRKLEQRIHAALHQYQLRGEWFVDCDAVRSLVNEALSGKYSFLDTPEEISLDKSGSPDREIGVLQSALREAHSLTNEIEARLESGGADIRDLVRSAAFLVEHVIAPTVNRT